ncbi:MAG: hypothetical protein ACREQN_01800 [Candidatus Binataceae bacterium]
MVIALWQQEVPNGGKKLAQVVRIDCDRLEAMPAITQAKNHGNDGLKGTYTFRLTPVTSLAVSAAAVGDPAGVATAPRQDVLRVGVFSADGKGNVSGHTIATTDTDAGATWIVDFTWTGTYSLNADGTGTLSVSAVTETKCTDSTTATVTQCTGTEEGPESYALVLNRHGEEKTVDLTETDNSGGGAKIFITGEAKLTNK